VATVVYDLDRGEESRSVVEAFINTGYFDIVRYVNSDAELVDTIVAGNAKVALKFPPDFTGERLLGRRATFQVMIDGSDSTVAMQALNVSNAISLERSLQVVEGQLDPLAMPPVEARPRMLFNPDMKTANFMVPGLVAIVMQVVTMFLTAFAIVKEKENGTLEQLMVTPVSRLGLVLGNSFPTRWLAELRRSSCCSSCDLSLGCRSRGAWRCSRRFR
jgi:ABC-2 type transport system permease protein